MRKNITILDGGFGQSIVNKGIAQIGTLWGCSAYLDKKDHHHVVDTHLEFIDAGSQIITTSNFTIRKRRLAQNNVENRLEEFLNIAGDLARKAVIQSQRKIKVAGSLPTQGETYKPDIYLSDEQLINEFEVTANTLNPYVDLFYLDVLCSQKEIECALKAVSKFNKDILIGIHLKKNGKLPSGEEILDLVPLIDKYNVKALIGGCISPEIYEISKLSLIKINCDFGFKINAFQDIPDNWSIQPGVNPNLNLGKRLDLDEDRFIQFCNNAIKNGATYIGGCCEIYHHHIKSFVNQL